MGMRITRLMTKEGDQILQAVKNNDGYCPCELEKTPDTKCMCKEFQEMKSGTCHCGLYTKEYIDD